MDDLSQFISTVGFPIAVAAYLLIRMETTIKSLTESVQRLTQLIELLTKEE